jgi:hypothetical protein
VAVVGAPTSANLIDSDASGRRWLVEPAVIRKYSIRRKSAGARELSKI